MASLLSPPLNYLSSSPTASRFPFPTSSLSSSPLLSSRGFRTTSATSLQSGSFCSFTRSPIFTSKPVGLFMKRRQEVLSAVSMTDGQSDEPTKISMDDVMYKARSYWDKLPDPIKSFPWNTTLKNFIQLIVELAASVVKYLSPPLLAVTALSEMSYCAQERKLRLVPIPLVIGFLFAGILRTTVLELTPRLKDAEVPWHLIAMAIIFILLKLPGPYYPYLGRLYIPHFANGGLLRTFWNTYRWYMRPQKDLK